VLTWQVAQPILSKQVLAFLGSRGCRKNRVARRNLGPTNELCEVVDICRPDVWSVFRIRVILPTVVTSLGRRRFVTPIHFR